MRKNLLITGLLLLLSLLISCGDETIGQNESVDELASSPAIEILAIVLNQRDVLQYLHQELPKRSPIVMIQNDHFKQSDLIDFKPAIFILSAQDVSSKNIEAYIEITEFKIYENQATLKFLYDIEGLLAEATLHQDKQKWILDTCSATER